MIYRAMECSCKYHQEPMDVWFCAASDGDALSILTTLLSVAWGVQVEDIQFGDVSSEIKMEKSSVQSPEAGDRRWYESGSWGDRPLYFRAAELAILDPRSLTRLYAAKAAAQMHAQEICHELDIEIAEAGADSARGKNLRLHYLNYRDFDGQPAAYAKARRVHSLPTKADVRQLRERHGLTQAAAAELVYATPNAWQKWEQGTRAMDRRTWELLQFKLGEQY